MSCDNSEGLTVRKSGKWTLIKLDFLRKYLNIFITSIRDSGWLSINYIDLFSGPGKNSINKTNSYCLGSPLIALSLNKKFDHYYYSDIDQLNIEVLKIRCANYPNNNRIHFFTGDANAVVDIVAKDIEDRDRTLGNNRKSSLNLAFLDPTGLELHWSTVERLAMLRTDMIIYYSQMGISRNARQQVNSMGITSIDKFFGDKHWREIYKQYQKGGISLHRPLLDYYKNKLEGFGYKVDDLTLEPVIKNSNGGPMYRLLFVSKHALGNKFWNIVTSKSDNGQGRLF